MSKMSISSTSRGIRQSDRHHNRTLQRESVRKRISSARLGPQLEELEVRSLLSTLPFSLFPTDGLRTDAPGSQPAWDVSLISDGEPASALVFAESGGAARLHLTDGQASWIAGVI